MTESSLLRPVQRVTSFFESRAAIACVGAICAVVSLSAGCDRGAAGLSLDKQQANQVLVQFLDTWKTGLTIADFRTAHPKVVVNDADWEQNVKLASYKLGQETDDGTNLHVTVELTLQDAAGNASPTSITYVIGTSPQVTIFRAY